jgi:hypothetical protein
MNLKGVTEVVATVEGDTQILKELKTRNTGKGGASITKPKQAEFTNWLTTQSMGVVSIWDTEGTERTKE